MVVSPSCLSNNRDLLESSAMRFCTPTTVRQTRGKMVMWHFFDAFITATMSRWLSRLSQSISKSSAVAKNLREDMVCMRLVSMVASERKSIVYERGRYYVSFSITKLNSIHVNGI